MCYLICINIVIFSKNNLHSVNFGVLPSSLPWDSGEKAIAYGPDHMLLLPRTKYAIRVVMSYEKCPPTQTTFSERDGSKIKRVQMLTHYRPKPNHQTTLKIKYNDLVCRQLRWHWVVSICSNYPVLWPNWILSVLFSLNI